MSSDKKKLCEEGLKSRKRELRRQVRESVAVLDPDYCREADRRILEHIVSLPEYGQAETVFCYVGRCDEIDTLPVIERMIREGKRVGVPVCVAKGIMEVREIRGREDLEDGQYGILEPGQSCPVIHPGEIDLALVPCMTCTREGVRLGYGGGYYDRYLSQETVRFAKAVLCRGRMMSEEIPVDEHDAKMDIVISEEGIFRAPCP